MMQFFMPMKPPTATAQEREVVVGKNGKPRFFDPPALEDARAKLTAHLAQHRPDAPFTGPLRVLTKWCFPRIKRAKHGQWKDTRPDTHNLNKMLYDIMTKLGFWKDDAQVVSEINEKFWSDKPGIFIQIEELL